MKLKHEDIVRWPLFTSAVREHYLREYRIPKGIDSRSVVGAWRHHCHANDQPVIIIGRHRGWATLTLDVDLLNCFITAWDGNLISDVLHSCREKKLAKWGKVEVTPIGGFATGLSWNLAESAAGEIYKLFMEAAAAGRVEWHRWNPPDYAKRELETHTGEPVRKTTVTFKGNEDGGNMGIVTDADKPETFVADAAEGLANMIRETPQAEWGIRLAYWLPQIVEVACCLKGYKADVVERKLIIAGDFSPDPFPTTAEVGPGIKRPEAKAGNGKPA